LPKIQRPTLKLLGRSHPFKPDSPSFFSDRSKVGSGYFGCVRPAAFKLTSQDARILSCRVLRNPFEHRFFRRSFRRSGTFEKEFLWSCCKEAARSFFRLNALLINLRSSASFRLANRHLPPLHSSPLPFFGYHCGLCDS